MSAEFLKLSTIERELLTVLNLILRLVFCDSFRGQRSDLAATRVERTSPRWQVLAYGFTVLKRTLLFGGGDDKDFSEGHKCARTLNSRTRKSVMCDQRRHARRLALKDIKREPHAHGGAEERPGGAKERKAWPADGF